MTAPGLLSGPAAGASALTPGCGGLQLLEDVQEEAKKYGAMQAVAVPKPPESVSAAEPARVFIRCLPSLLIGPAAL